MEERKFNQPEPQQSRKDQAANFLAQNLERAVAITIDRGVGSVFDAVDLLTDTAEKVGKFARKLRDDLPPDQRA